MDEQVLDLIRSFTGAIECSNCSSHARTLKNIAKPGDVIIESNLHYWQWVALSYLTTGTTWVHASLVSHDGKILTVAGKVVELPIDVYCKWRSTKVAVIRPRYSNVRDLEDAIGYAKAQLQTPYDPTFKNANASCTGLVGEALTQENLPVHYKMILGRRIYPANAFFHLPGARLLWSNSRTNE